MPIAMCSSLRIVQKHARIAVYQLRTHNVFSHELFPEEQTKSWWTSFLASPLQYKSNSEGFQEGKLIMYSILLL